MARKTIAKPVALSYGEVGNTKPDKELMGVLKGIVIDQELSDEDEVESEFEDTPFDVIYSGKPLTFTFELTNYDLETLPDLFGGYCKDGEYISDRASTVSEHTWRLEFAHGGSSLIIYRGLTVGSIKKDGDGALNFSVRITSLMDKSDAGTERLYGIIGRIGYDDAYVSGDVLVFPNMVHFPSIAGDMISLNNTTKVEEEGQLLVIN